MSIFCGNVFGLWPGTDATFYAIKHDIIALLHISYDVYCSRLLSYMISKLLSITRHVCSICSAKACGPCSLTVTLPSICCPDFLLLLTCLLNTDESQKILYKKEKLTNISKNEKYVSAGITELNWVRKLLPLKA